MRIKVLLASDKKHLSSPPGGVSSKKVKVIQGRPKRQVKFKRGCFLSADSTALRKQISGSRLIFNLLLAGGDSVSGVEAPCLLSLGKCLKKEQGMKPRVESHGRMKCNWITYVRSH